MGIERHHGAFDRISWSARKEARALRNDPHNIYWMEHDPHRELHDAVPFVPVLGWQALQIVLREYYPATDPGKNLDHLIKAIEIAKQHPRACELERTMADLAISAFDMQRPFILDNRNRHDN